MALEDSYSNFVNSIKSEHTRIYYIGVLNRFKDYCGVTNYTDLLFGEDRKQVEAKLIAWLNQQKVNGVKASTLNGYLAALWHFYQHNDLTSINWTKIKAFMPEKNRPTKDRAYTVEEIRKVLDICDVRMKVVFLLMATSGLRIGSIPKLKVKDLERMDRLYKITVYEGDHAEYVTFCSPETARAIDDYLDYRKRAGEEIKPDAPLIREQIAIPNEPRHVALYTLTQLTISALVKSGVRKEGDNRYARQPVMANHGFRKFCKQQLRRAKVEPVLIERLLGHRGGDPELGVSKLMLTYDPEDLEEMAQEYGKAIDYLTISTEKKLRMENEELKQKIKSQSSTEAELAEMRAKMARYEEMAQRMLKQGKP